MNHKVRFPNLLRLVVLVFLASCQTVTTPIAIATSQATVISPATATPQPTATPLPTTTSVPLCGTIVSPSTATVVTDAPKETAKFEPPDGQIYFGFHYKLWDESPPSANAKWGDTRPFAERICDSVKFELSGKIPTLMVVYSVWTSPFSSVQEDINKIQTALGSSVTPMVDWQADLNTTTKDIASGQLDEYITRYARDVKLYGKPLFIRLICSGFNGNWDPGCSPTKGNPDLTSADFVNAWQQVVNIFQQEGVTNVAWVWEPAAPPPPSVGDWGWWSQWQDYYPGDEYVDWVGAIIWDTGKSNWINPIYQFGVDYHHKPILVEFAIRHELANLSHQQQINWLKEMFDYFDSHPQIKAISYINIRPFPDPNPASPTHVFIYNGEVNYQPDVRDFDQRLIAGGDDIRELFANQIADPRYISVLMAGP